VSRIAILPLIFMPFALLGVAAGALLLSAGCASGLPTPAQQADLGAWTADDGVCVATATNRAQADACRDSMRRVFCGADGGLLADSGSCVDVRLSDGGKP
jgi:hypothetical protein